MEACDQMLAVDHDEGLRPVARPGIADAQACMVAVGYEKALQTRTVAFNEGSVMDDDAQGVVARRLLAGGFEERERARGFEPAFAEVGIEDDDRLAGQSQRFYYCLAICRIGVKGRFRRMVHDGGRFAICGAECGARTLGAPANYRCRDVKCPGGR